MQRTHTRLFTTEEVATFDYCPLTWWYEQFEPWVQAENEELFARLVELEHEQGTQAPALPEYRLIEQLLLRRGAFDEEHKAQEPDETAEEHEEVSPDDPQLSGLMLRRTQLFARATLIFGILAVLFLAGAFFFH